MTEFSFIICDPIESFGTLEQFADVLRHLKQLGFDGVEFNITDHVVEQQENLLALVESVQLPIVSFLTGANYFGQGLCLSSPREDVRRTAVEKLGQFTKTAGRFGAVLVVGQMQGFRSDEPIPVVASERIETALRQVAVQAEINQATVVVEPVNHLQCGFHNTLEAVMSLTDRIGSDRVKPMLDSFHMNIEETSMTEPILRAGQELKHFHLCESNGDFLGSGHLDIPLLLTTLDDIGYQGFVSVKVYRQPWEAAASATIDYFRSIAAGEV